MENNTFYKNIDLFGNEQVNIIANKKKLLKKTYDDFIDKFEHKKTTDDCYTPKEVYQIVLDYVGQKVNLSGMEIIRPFYPGGDFESIDYTDDMVVIDNPPFSIITKICKYYIANGVKFFLFCPHLTAFSADMDCTYIVASADITYENGAVIKTAFVSNMFGDLKIIGDPDLHLKFKELQQINKSKFPKYKYPDHIITVSKIAYCVEKGISIFFDKKDLMYIRFLDAQKEHGKTLYGNGFIASDKAAVTIAAATAAAATAAAQKDVNVFVWELSEREMDIVKSLG